MSIIIIPTILNTVLSNNHFIYMRKAFRNSTIIQDATRLITQKSHILFLKADETSYMKN